MALLVMVFSPLFIFSYSFPMSDAWRADLYLVVGVVEFVRLSVHS